VVVSRSRTLWLSSAEKKAPTSDGIGEFLPDGS
jgi:hypothetical protein